MTKHKTEDRSEIRTLAPAVKGDHPAPDHGMHSSARPADELFQTREQLLLGVARAIGQLHNSLDLAGGINEALSFLGKAAGVDRVYIFENELEPASETPTTSRRYEWTRQGASNQTGNPEIQNVPPNRGFNRWFKTLSTGKSIAGFVRDFPADERSLLESQKIVSVIAVPIMIRRSFWGFVGFDDCTTGRQWSSSETAFLEAAAGMIGSAIDRQNMWEELVMERDLALGLASAPELSEALDLCLRLTLRVARLDSGGIYVVEPETGDLVLAHALGLSELFTSSVRRIGRGDGRWQIVMDGHPVYYNYDPADPQAVAMRDAEGIRSVATIPITHDGRVVAAFNVASHLHNTIPPFSRNALEVVAGTLGNAITRLQMQERLRKSEQDLSGLTTELEQRVAERTNDLHEINDALKAEMRERITMESEVREQTAFLDELVNGVQEGIGVVDENETIIVCNRAFASIYEVEMDQLIGRNLLDFLKPESYNQITRQSGERRAGTHATYELSIITGKGVEKELLVTVSPRFGPDGVYRGAFGTLLDITFRKRNEEQLRFQASLLGNISDAIFSVDIGSRVHTWNNAAVDMFGWTVEETLGRPLDHFVVLESEEFERDAIMRKLTTSGHWEGELPQKRKDGAPIYIHLATTMLRDAQGNFSGSVSVSRDVTLRRRTQEDLRISEAKFAGILDHAADAIVSMDDRNDIAQFNHAAQKLFGYTPREIFGKPFLLLLPIDGDARVLAAFQRFVAGQDAELHFGKNRPLRGRRKDGEEFIAEAHFSKLQVHGSTLITMVARDISELVEGEEIQRKLQTQLESNNTELTMKIAELKFMQNSLVQSEKMASIGQLTAGIAHEINNPLAFVSSNLNRFNEHFTDLLKILRSWQGQGDKLPREAIAPLRELEASMGLDFMVDDFSKLMGFALEGSDRIRNIVERLRGFSHMAGDTYSLSSLNDALEDTLTITWNEIKYRATVKRDYGVLPAVLCNIGEIKQVFVNLLVNAAQSIKDNGEIVVRTYADDDDAIVQISDTGAGIPPENIKRIFDPFFTTKPVGKGTGLGLWICTQLIHKHMGSIDVRSTPGEGTTFTIRLPLHPQPAPEAA